MKKYSFKDDYSEGCHPDILKALIETNLEQLDGYGDDKYCDQARRLIKHKIGNSNADIHFVSGGTQANLIVIASILKSFEAVICTQTGHINVHEAGAIEATGHKIEVIHSTDGKLTPDAVQTILEKCTDHHMVRPKLVYISNSTEVGTIYNKNELSTLFQYCRNRDLYLFLDGARIGSALCSEQNDLSLEDLSAFTDVFYIGGTKNGALLGEAIVINNKMLKRDFNFHIKQRGALIAKERIIGLQFVELFKENLFFKLARHANSMAMELANGIKQKGYRFLSEPMTNQIFPVFPGTLIDRLSEKYHFHVWRKIDGESVAIRLVTSWATRKEKVYEFIRDLDCE